MKYLAVRARLWLDGMAAVLGMVLVAVADAPRRLRTEEAGQGMAEYGVILAVVTIGAVGVFTALSGGISGAINRVVGLMPK
jgi:pilus assembly protein Flp/PilA